MMKAKSKIIIATFILTCLIYNYHQIKNRDIKNPFKVETFGGRRLSEEEEETERGVSEDLKEGFAKYCDAASDKFKKNQKNGDYSIELDEGEENLLVDYLKTDDAGKLLEYAKKNIAILILMCFSILTIFFWIFYCCFCCCYNGCCCNSCCCCCCCFNVAKEGKCYDFLSFVLAAGAYGAIIILGITSLSISSKFIQGTNGAFCGIFDFYRTMIEGDDKETTPKWAGIDGASNLLEEIETSFGDGFNPNALDLFPGTSCDTIDTATCEAMLPINPIQSGYCSGFAEEKTIFENDIKGNFHGIDPTEVTGETLTDAKDSINGIRELIEGFDSILDLLKEAEPIINKTIPATFYAFFAAIAGVAAYQLAYILLLCFGCCNCCPLKFIFHVVWNIMLLITIFTFLLGGFFSIFGIIGKDGTGAFAYITSEDNFNRKEPVVFGKGDSNELINTCLNGDGDLSEELNLTGIDGMNQMTELYKTKGKLEEYANSDDGLTVIGTNSANFSNPADVTTYAACHDNIRAGSQEAANQIGGFLEVTAKYSDTKGIMAAFNCSKYFYFNF